MDNIATVLVRTCQPRKEVGLEPAPLPGDPHDTAEPRASQSDETGSESHAAALSAEMAVRVMEHASSFLRRACKPPKGRLLPSPGAFSLTSSVSE